MGVVGGGPRWVVYILREDLEQVEAPMQSQHRSSQSNRRGCRAVEVIVHSEEEATFVSILVAVSPRCADGLLGGVVEPVALKFLTLRFRRERRWTNRQRHGSRPVRTALADSHKFERTGHRQIIRQPHPAWGAGRNQRGQQPQTGGSGRAGKAASRRRRRTPQRVILSTLEQSRRLALHAPWESAGNGISPAGTTERDR